MTDYDPRRPSGSGPEPIDPTGGSPYAGPTGPPPSTGYPPPGGRFGGVPDAGGGYGAGAGNPVSAAPTGQLPPYAAAQPQQYGQQQAAPQQYGQQQPTQYGQPYPAQYGPPYGAPGYAAPGYSPYGYAGWGGPARPGQVIGAAVLSYIEAGLLIISALFVFAGASIVNDTADSFNTSDGGITAQFVLAGIANLAAAGLFIAGGAMFTGANQAGRTIMVSAVALTAVTALFWVIRFHDGGVVVWAIAFLVMPAIAVSLSFGRSVNAWLQLPRAR